MSKTTGHERVLADCALDLGHVTVIGGLVLKSVKERLHDIRVDIVNDHSGDNNECGDAGGLLEMFHDFPTL